MTKYAAIHNLEDIKNYSNLIMKLTTRFVQDAIASV